MFSLDTSCAARGINYAEKSFITLKSLANFIQHFSVICAAMSVLPEVLTQVMPLGT